MTHCESRRLALVAPRKVGWYDISCQESDPEGIREKVDGLTYHKSRRLAQVALSRLRFNYHE